MHRVLLALLASLVWLSASEASAYCRLTTAEPSATGACSTAGRGLAWDRQCISYTVMERERNDIPLATIRNTIDESFGQWLAVQCNTGGLPLDLGQTVELGMCAKAQYNQFGPNANTIMFLEQWEGKDFPREAFGLTLVWHDPDTGEIFDADMQLNETIAPIAVCGADCDRNVVDLSNVVTHEAGHFLGLGHSNVFGATMSANALLGETSKRSLEQDDKDGVCSIYARYAPPVCDAQAGDFAPDRGFTARCGSDDVDDAGCKCAVPGERASSSHAVPFAAAGIMVALVLAARRRRDR